MPRDISGPTWRAMYSWCRRPPGRTKSGRRDSDDPVRPRAPGGRRWLWLVALPVVWEAARLALRPSPLVMPSSLDILRALGRGAASGDLPVRWILSLAVVSAGLTAGALGALGLALFSRSGRAAASLLSALSSLMHPLPGLALLPLVILWAGIGFQAVLVIIVHAVLWPIYVNLESGMRSLAPAWTLYARNLRLGRWKTFARIVLPGTFPHLISGLRTGWARAWRAFIAAEMVFGAVGAGGGLGWQLFESRVMMDTPALYAALIAVMLTGMAMEELLLGRWETRVRRKWGEAVP